MTGFSELKTNLLEEKDEANIILEERAIVLDNIESMEY